MGESTAQRRCFFIGASSVAASGENIANHWKSWEDTESGEGHRWEFRRVAVSLWSHRRNMMPLYIVKEQRESWYSVWRSFGLPTVIAWAASRHAAAMKGVQDDSADAEASLSTSALIFVLALWATKHRHRALQQRALIIWGLWFEQGMGAGAAMELMPTEAPPEVRGLCEAPVVERGLCGCMTHMASDIEHSPVPTTSPQRQLVWAIARRFSHAVSTGCPSSKAWCLRLVVAAAAAQDMGVEARCCSDPLTAPHALMLGPGGAKRRRIDEDLKLAATLTVSRSGAAASSSAWGRATGAAVCSTAQRWGEAYLAQMRAASLLTFANSQRLYLAFDCGRFGNPGEETLVLVVWDGEQNRSAWLPIQAIQEWGSL